MIRATTGSGAALLTGDVEFGAVSPDGEHIAYILTSEGHVALYLMNTDGSGVVRLLSRPAPEW